MIDLGNPFIEGVIDRGEPVASNMPQGVDQQIDGQDQQAGDQACGGKAEQELSIASAHGAQNW